MTLIPYLCPFLTNAFKHKERERERRVKAKVVGRRNSILRTCKSESERRERKMKAVVTTHTQTEINTHKHTVYTKSPTNQPTNQRGKRKTMHRVNHRPRHAATKTTTTPIPTPTVPATQRVAGRGGIWWREGGWGDTLLRLRNLPSLARRHLGHDLLASLELAGRGLYYYSRVSWLKSSFVRLPSPLRLLAGGAAGATFPA